MIPEDALIEAWNKYFAEHSKLYVHKDALLKDLIYDAFMSGALAVISLQSRQLSEDLDELRALVAHSYGEKDDTGKMA